MAEEVILKVGVQGTGDGETKIKSLKAQLKELKLELEGVDEGSTEFKKLAAAAAEVQDKMNMVNQSVKSLADNKLNLGLKGLAESGQAIAGGFQAAQGAMALFGSDSKEVEKAIQQIIAVQGVMNGVQAVNNALQDDAIIGMKLREYWKKIDIASTGVAIAAQKAWNMVIAANPIMLMVTAITAVVGAFALFTKGANASAAGQKALNDAMIEGDKAAAKEEANIKILTATILNNNASLKDKRKAIEELNAIAPEYLGNITLENIGTQESISAINQYIDSIRTKIELQALEAQLQETISERLEITRRIRNEEMELTDPTRLEFLQKEEKSILGLIQARQTSNQELQKEVELKGTLSGAGGDSSKVEERAREAQSEADRLAEIERERLAQELEDQKRADEARFEYETNLRAADFAFQENLKAEQLQREQEQFDAEFEQLEAQIDRENAVRDLQEQQEKERKERNLKLAEDYSKAVVGLTQNIFTLTNNLGKQDEANRQKRAERQFKIKKDLDVAEAAIDGTKAVLSTFANTPGGIVIKSVAAAAAGVFAAAKIAAIGSAKFDGGASVSTPSVGGSAGESASNVGNVTPNIQGVPAGSTLLNQPTQKVVVVESDITKIQKKVGVIEAQATYGMLAILVSIFLG